MYTPIVGARHRLDWGLELGGVEDVRLLKGVPVWPLLAYDWQAALEAAVNLACQSDRLSVARARFGVSSSRRFAAMGLSRLLFGAVDNCDRLEL